MIQENVNINEYPKIIQKPTGIITFGDMHGNALKLLHILVKNKVIEIDEGSYHKLKNIYKKKVNELVIDDFDEFIELLQVKTNDFKVRFIGDMLADRGENDWYNLILLKNINYDVVLSNHDVAFINSIEYAKKEGNLLNFTGLNPSVSLNNAIECVDLNLFSLESLVKLYDLYSTHLKLFDFVKLKNKLRIYSHAPITAEYIPKCLKLLSIDKKNITIDAYIKSMKDINNYVATCALENKLSKLFENIFFQEIIWNREYMQDKASLDGIEFEFVHGHVGDEETLYEHYINLDTNLGKSNLNNEGLLKFILD